MDSKAFFELTARMREAQKWYFNTRSSNALKESKYLERELDKEIARVQAILNDSQEQEVEITIPSLFVD